MRDFILFCVLFAVGLVGFHFLFIFIGEYVSQMPCTRWFSMERVLEVACTVLASGIFAGVGTANRTVT